jgi:ribosomal protection tetracycline resistance protein
MEALKRAGTDVCEPIERFTLDVPTGSVGEAYGLLSSTRATATDVMPRGNTSRMTGTIPSAEVHRFEQHVPALARGEAVFTAAHEGYRTIQDRWPERARTDLNPLNRKRYLALVSQT